MGLPQGSASRMGQLTANPSGVAPSGMETDLRTPAWWLTDMSPIVLGMPDEKGGEGINIPGAPGRSPTFTLPDETVYVMPFHVVGDCDASGTPATGTNGTLIQLRRNRQHLLQNVAGPYDGTETRVFKLTFTDGTSVLFQAKASLNLVRQNGADADYVLDLRVPGGYV